MTSGHRLESTQVNQDARGSKRVAIFSANYWHLTVLAMHRKIPSQVEPTRGQSDEESLNQKGNVVYSSDLPLDDQPIEKLFRRGAAMAFCDWLIAIICIAIASTGRNPVIFGVGGVLALQGGIVNWRSIRLFGPSKEDEEARIRVASMLEPLCANAGCSVPNVSVRNALMPAGMLGGRGQSTLLLSPELLRSVDDGALRAILAHEIVHVSRGDLVAARRRQLFAFLAPYVLGLAAVVTIGRGSAIAFMIWIAFLFPGIRFIFLLLGFTIRWRETRADVEGSAVIGDGDAMIRGLRAIYDIAVQNYTQVCGRRPWRWTLFPYSIRATTHPSLEHRIATIQSVQAPPPTAN